MDTKEPSFFPRGLSRADAARYVGVGDTLFTDLVANGTMPKPRVVGRRRIWDRYELERAFDDLPRDDEATLAEAPKRKNSWD